MLELFILVLFLSSLIFLFNKFLQSKALTLKRKTVELYTSIYERAQKEEKGEAIGFGYTGCKDITVDAFDLFDKLDVSFVPRENTRIVTVQDFAETFASFFSVGASTELFMESKENFDYLLSKVAALPKSTTFGGNAPHMALRAAYENFDAVVIADIGQEEVSTIKALDSLSKIRFVAVNEGRETSDVHLIFEYPPVEYKGVKAPKANKFYLNHDTISPKLPALDKYLSAAVELNLSKHALSGFHLIQKLPAGDSIELLHRVRTQWEQLRKRGKQTIHMEMGAFQNPKVYQAVIENLLLRADSVGINEQEILVLHAFLKERDFRTLAVPFSDPSLLLTKVFEILEILEERKATLSRFHIHAKSMHHLCYRDDLWRNGMGALVAGIMAGYKLCSNSTTVNVNETGISYEALESINKNFVYSGAKLSLRPSPIITIRKGRWVCLSGVALICERVRKMAGLGDNISGAGFIYHHMKHESI